MYCKGIEQNEIKAEIKRNLTRYKKPKATSTAKKRYTHLFDRKQTDVMNVVADIIHVNYKR